MRRTLHTMLRTGAALGLVGVVTPIACAGLALATLIFLPLPATLPQAEPTVSSRTSHILDITGAEIATFKDFETAIPVQPGDIPQVLRDALIAAEDRNFYSHGGVDLRGTLRALWADIRSGEQVQGGSTITQQYVRMAFEEIGTERTLSRKIREAILASQLDRQVDKDTILFEYLNAVYLGEGAYGVGAAAETYFRKPVSQLTLSEAALLVGVIPAPTAYSPRDHPEAAETKRRLVLDAMLEVGSITPEQHAAASAEALWLTSGGFPPEGQPVTLVHPSVVQQSSQPWFTDYVRVWLEANLPGCPGAGQRCPLLYQGGLTIETTMDPVAQAAAQAQVADALADRTDDMEAAIVAVEPPTGFVRALVGGRDWNLSQVNTALRERQPGSSFKPIVLAEAFEQGIQREASYSGSSYTVGDHTFQNYGGSQYGTVSLERATTSSINAAYVRLIEDVSVQETFDMAARLGLSMPAFDPAASSPNGLVDVTNPATVYGLAVALGTVEASPLEMASAFATFANHGRRAAPTPVIRVLAPDGDELLDNTEAADAAEPVVAPEVADNVTDVLRGVLTDGTAAGRALPDRPAAGKTGTAQENANAWFVGYTPTLATAVWFGHRDCGAGPDCRITGVAGVRGAMTGGSAPARLWQQFMTTALEGVEVTEFAEPAPIPDVHDQIERDRRHGFDPGTRRRPDAAPASEGWIEEEQAVLVEAPPPTTAPPRTTSTSSPSTSSSTSTTICRGIFCD